MKKKMTRRMQKKELGRQLVIGSGGGGKGGGGGGRAAQEAPDTLHSTQYANVIDALCEGPIVGLVNGMRSIYYNETPIVSSGATANFKDVIVQWTNGTQDQAPLSGNSDIETETSVAQFVDATLPVVRTLNNPSADSLRVTVSVPVLTSQDMTTGDINGSSVTLTVDVQDLSSATGYVQKVVDTISGKTTSEYKRSYKIALSGTGPWNIRVSRATPDETSSAIQNRFKFDSFTGIISSRLSYPNTVLVSANIDAQNFNAIPSRAYDIKGLIIKVPSNYDPVTRAYTGIWNGTFKLAWTDNPAWCFYDLLTNDRYGLGDVLPSYAIDQWTLYQIGQYCDEMIPNGFGGTEPRFTCNLCLRTREEALRVIQNFASIFRAITFWGAGSVVTVQDRMMAPIAVYSNANVIDGEFSYQGASLKQRHTVVLVSWNDPSDFYRQKIEYVQDDEGVRTLGVVQNEVTAFGCTSRGQAHRLGKWMLLTEKYISETISFKTGLDACVVYPGAIINTADRNRAGKRIGGRIASSTLSSLTIDQDFVLEAGKSYTVSVMDGNAVAHTSGISNSAGTTRTLNLIAPLTALPVAGASYVITANDLAPETWRVVGLKEEDDYTISVMAVAYNASLFASVDADMGFAPLQTTTINARPLAPVSLNAISTPYIVANKVVGNKITLSWSSTAPRFRVIWTSSQGVSQTREVYESSIIIDNAAEDVYKFSVVAISSIGIESTPALYTYTLGAKVRLPLPLVSLTPTPDMFQTALSWVYSAEIDISKVEIWAATNGLLASATKLCDLSYPTSHWVHMGLAMGVTVTYWARVQDTTGNYSPYIGPVSATTLSDPTIAAAMLAQQVTTSSLFSNLSTRVNAIDGPATTPGTVAYQLDYIKTVNNTNVAAVAYGNSAITANTGTVANSITTLETSVNSNTASIATQATSTDGLKAEYSVKLDVNGYISGYGQSNTMVNGVQYSDFTILADRFAVVTPGQAKKVPFVVGTINGVTTVGLNGATIVDGSISAKSLDVQNLSISARDVGSRMVFTPEVMKVIETSPLGVDVVRVKIGNLLL